MLNVHGSAAISIQQPPRQLVGTNMDIPTCFPPKLRPCTLKGNRGAHPGSQEGKPNYTHTPTAAYMSHRPKPQNSAVYNSPSKVARPTHRLWLSTTGVRKIVPRKAKQKNNCTSTNRAPLPRTASAIHQKAFSLAPTGTPRPRRPPPPLPGFALPPPSPPPRPASALRPAEGVITSSSGSITYGSAEVKASQGRYPSEYEEEEVEEVAGVEVVGGNAATIPPRAKRRAVREASNRRPAAMPAAEAPSGAACAAPVAESRSASAEACTKRAEPWWNTLKSDGEGANPTSRARGDQGRFFGRKRWEANEDDDVLAHGTCLLPSQQDPQSIHKTNKNVKPSTHTNRQRVPMSPCSPPQNTNPPGFQRTLGDPPSPSLPPCSGASERSAAPLIQVRPPGGAPRQGKVPVRAPCLLGVVLLLLGQPELRLLWWWWWWRWWKQQQKPKHD